MVDPAVDLDVDVLRQGRSQPRDPIDGFRHEGLAAVPGVDAHAENEVGVSRDRGNVFRLALGVEGDADLEAVLAGGGDRAWHVVDDLVMEGRAVTAGAGDLREVAQWVVDHQMAVEDTACLVHQRSDRLEHDRSDRDRLDEVPVADVVVEDAHTGADQALQLLAEPREVGRIDRGLDLGRPDLTGREARVGRR